MKLILIIVILAFSTFSFAEDNMKRNANEISKHYFAQPSLYPLEAMSKEKLTDKISRQYVMGSQTMLVKWSFKKGAVVPLHFHPNEQVTWITEGSVRVLSQGKEFIVKAGEVIIIPPNVPHEFHALSDTIDIDFFTPVREDWLNGKANYISLGVKK